MSSKIIGRKRELAILEECYKSDSSEFIAIYGRRRVGKTYMIRQALGSRFALYVTGLANGKKKEQLCNFCQAVSQYLNIDYVAAENWMQAFRFLSEAIRNNEECRGKKVLFIDEMPWMDTPQSDFLMALEWFWNSFASARDDIMLIVCGSATTWITNKIIHNHGGLYGRLTSKIHLKPFTLAECEEFYAMKKIVMKRHEQLMAYMIFGGIPYYLNYLKHDQSLDQNVNRLCFAENAILKNEYHDLYRSLFNSPEKYIAVVNALAGKSSGMNRNELCKTAKLQPSGATTKILEDLELCGFIRSFNGLGKGRKNKMFQFVDFFSLFYLKFMANNGKDKNFWTHIINTPTYNTWSGYAFEQVCLAHTEQIKKALGISGILTNVASWRSNAKRSAAQIDLVIERADKMINLCEMKYSTKPYTITKSYSASLERKKWAFEEETKTKYGIFQTMITTYGVSKKGYFGSVDCEVIMDDLFIK